jgi:transcriptional regulator with XRE-family HTH domain
MDASPDTLQDTLQRARRARRLSQLELSMRVGVSQRHVSFVERGRARPSRALLLAWLQALDAPLVVRNAAMLQAGFAPAYTAAPLNDPALAAAQEAVLQLLKVHDPMPAMVIDSQWNLLHLNRGARWLAATLVPWVTNLPSDAPMNLLDLLCHPEGFTRPIVNLREVGPSMLAHLRSDAAIHPQLVPRVASFAALLEQKLGPSALSADSHRPAAPVLTTRFATPHGELAFFSMFTTFGTPQDITLESLKVEHLFAVDDLTRSVLQRHVP